MTEIWAHRGASAYAPENTIPAFQMAIDQGAQGIELDLQRSADGVLVAVHDETISRTSSGFGRVVDLTFDEMRRCDFSNGFIGHRNVRIPTLSEVLDLVRPTNLSLNVELKNSVELYPDIELEAADRALVTADRVTHWHRRGWAVNVWTVDEEKDVAHAIEIGVDALVTNFPDRARRVVRMGR